MTMPDLEQFPNDLMGDGSAQLKLTAHGTADGKEGVR